MRKIALCLALLLCCLLPVRAAEDDVQLQQADINISTSGDNTVIAADAGGKRVFIYKMWFTTAGAVNVVFKDGTTAFNGGAIVFVGNGSSLYFPFDGKSYFETSGGNAFKMNLSGAVQVSGRVYYALR